MVTLYDLMNVPVKSEIRKKMLWNIVMALLAILLGMSSILIALILSISYRV